MKKTTVLAILLAALALTAVGATLDPKEPVTLDLKEASLTEVIRTIGAMTNLDVVIAPGIEGNVTIQLKEVPFEKVLDILGKANGISLRIEDGKLVASRSGNEPAAAAAAVPDPFRDAPKFPLAEYADASAAPPPLLIKTIARDAQCWTASVQKGGGGVLEIPLPNATLVVADLGYDPVWKNRALAIEVVGGVLKRNINLGPGGSAVLTELSGQGDSTRVVISQVWSDASTGEGRCSLRLFQAAQGIVPVTVSMQATAGSRGGNVSPVFDAVRIQTMAGTVFKALGSDADSGEGQLHGYAVSGYVSRDGKSVAVAFKARAAWTSSEDGRQYYFTQPGESSGFVPLTRAGVLASTIQPGVATARALELRVFGGE